MPWKVTNQCLETQPTSLVQHLSTLGLFSNSSYACLICRLNWSNVSKDVQWAVHYRQNQWVHYAMTSWKERGMLLIYRSLWPMTPLYSLESILLQQCNRVSALQLQTVCQVTYFYNSKYSCFVFATVFSLSYPAGLFSIMILSWMLVSLGHRMSILGLCAQHWSVLAPWSVSCYTAECKEGYNK